MVSNLHSNLRIFDYQFNQLRFPGRSSGISTHGDSSAPREPEYLQLGDSLLRARVPEDALRRQHDPGGRDVSGKMERGEYVA